MLGLIYKQEKEYECVTDYQTVSINWHVAFKLLQQLYTAGFMNNLHCHVKCPGIGKISTPGLKMHHVKST